MHCQDLKLKLAVIFSLSLVILPKSGVSGIWGFDGQRSAFTHFVWEYRMKSFDYRSYRKGINLLFRSFEDRTGRDLVPGIQRRAGIKVYTSSGRGISTPLPLVRAVITALKQRGFDESELFVIDMSEHNLRDSGFIPPLSRREKRDRFHGVPVYWLDNRQYYDPIWFYDSPLPSVKVGSSLGDLVETLEGRTSGGDGRKSFLPKVLLTDVDFWINIPMVLDNRAVGVSGALVNATLWNISNHDRFFSSPANAPIATAEIAAIPELVSGLVVTILPMERYQFIGGPVFNSLYTRSEKLVWMSPNPVVLDALALRRINIGRKEAGFCPLGVHLPMLNFAESLELGTADISKISWIRLP